MASNSEQLLTLKRAVQQDLTDRLVGSTLQPSDAELAEVVNHFVKQYEAAHANEGSINYGKKGRDAFIRACVNDFAHLGPLEPLLAHSNISEIMVNGCDQVYVEYQGKLMEVESEFEDNDHVRRIIDRIVQQVNRHIDEQTPYVDARLKDGSRVNATIPPISIDYPTLTIRKFSDHKLTWNDYLKWGTVNEQMVQFLQAAVLARCNILVSGGTGSGKSLNSNTLVFTQKNDKLAVQPLSSLSVGDSIVSGNGEVSHITGVYPQGQLPVFEVELKDGRVIEASADHLWTVGLESHGTYKTEIVTTQDMIDRGITRLKSNGRSHVKHFWIPRCSPIRTPDVSLPLPPWVLGYLIGNGHLTHSNAVCYSHDTCDMWVTDRMREHLPCGMSIAEPKSGYTYRIRNSREWLDIITDLNLAVHSYEKFIPDSYKFAGLDQRIAIFRGLMDSDGACSFKGHASYSTTSKRLAEDVLFVGRTLGFTGRITEDRREGKYTNTSGVAYIVHFTGAPLNPFSLPRKADLWAATNAKECNLQQTVSFIQSGSTDDYLAGACYTAKFLHHVPYLKTRRLSSDTMERIMLALPDGSSFAIDNGGCARIICPRKDGRRNGATLVAESFGYDLDGKVTERSIPSRYEKNSEFLCGLADVAGVVRDGTMVFYATDVMRDSICALLDSFGLEYTLVHKSNGKTKDRNAEITVYGYPSDLVHDSLKKASLDAWTQGGRSLRDDYVPIVDIRKTDRTAEMVCIKVADDSHTFVLADGTVTHNTTLLNVLSNEIPRDQRILTIEDSAELQLGQPHVVRFETRPPNNEGAGQVTIHDLIVNSLRMRPDRIIVGECRSEETIEMLQAMNTGHDGSLTTVHANSPKAAFERIETMVLQGSASLPSIAIKRQIATALDIIVHTQRLLDGSRKVMSIGAVADSLEGEAIPYAELFRFEQTEITGEAASKRKVEGRFVGVGMPTDNILAKFDSVGLDCDPRWFLE